MKRKVYLETSIVSYYSGSVSRDIVIAGARNRQGTSGTSLHTTSCPMFPHW